MFEQPGHWKVSVPMAVVLELSRSFISLLPKSFGICIIVKLYDFMYLIAIRSYIKPVMYFISEHIWASLRVYTVMDSIKTCDKIFSKTESDTFRSLVI